MKRRSFMSHLLLSPVALSLLQLRAEGEDVDALLSGPMVGYSEITETVIWLQTRRAARAQLRYWVQGKPETARISEEYRTTQAGDFIAKFTLSGLAFGTRYDYEVYLDGHRIERPYAMTFQTQPMWKWRTEPPPFKVAFGSCHYVNDPPFDRPGRPYGSPAKIFSAIMAHKPDVMLWLGDNCYYREADYHTEAGMRYRYAHTRAQAELQPLWAATHHYAIWDDHDYGPNDSDRTFRGRDTALRIFRDYWGNPAYGRPDIPGCFFRFEWADIEFFMLDGRYHRTPNELSDDSPEKMLFGREQLQWLLESLRSSQATFKVVVGGGQMLNPVSPWECFSRFKVEQARLFDFIRAEKISGVLFISGDRHLAELNQRREPGLYPLYDFTSSSLTAGIATLSKAEQSNPARVSGTLVEKHNFGILEFSGSRATRLLTMRCIDEDGIEHWKREIPISELRFPRQADKSGGWSEP
ncbi:MAG: alkaline phosphatase D family protein [Chloracidobacterium sp.]